MHEFKETFLILSFFYGFSNIFLDRKMRKCVDSNVDFSYKNQNIATKCINICRLVIILASLESWEYQFSTDAKIVKIRAI